MTNAAIMETVLIAGAIERITIERGKWRQVMIIFDLDGTLADCEHRRHFVDPKYQLPMTDKEIYEKMKCLIRGKEPDKWQPDWKAFYEACDKDVPITPAIYMLEYIGEGKEYGSDTPRVDYDGVQIWSGRCESVRGKTEKWLAKHLRYYHENYPVLKMRPIGNTEPDEVLKERWLDEYLTLPRMDVLPGKVNGIQFVFDDRPKVVRMWRRRGIFVFNCCQHDGEF